LAKTKVPVNKSIREHWGDLKERSLEPRGPSMPKMDGARKDKRDQFRLETPQM